MSLANSSHRGSLVEKKCHQHKFEQ